MAIEGGIRVEGLTQLARNLQALGLELDDIKDAFAAIADDGAKLAAGFAPNRSGALAGTIRGNRAKNKAVVSAGKKSIPYAGAQNYGWGNKNAAFKTGKYASGIKGSFAGHHFMQKADEAMKPRALQELEDAINAKIRAKGLG